MCTLITISKRFLVRFLSESFTNFGEVGILLFLGVELVLDQLGTCTTEIFLHELMLCRELWGRVVSEEIRAYCHPYLNFRKLLIICRRIAYHAYYSSFMDTLSYDDPFSS